MKRGAQVVSEIDLYDLLLKGDKSGELTLWIGKRLIVTVEGEKIAGTSVLQEAAKAIDYNKIGPL